MGLIINCVSQKQAYGLGLVGYGIKGIRPIFRTEVLIYQPNANLVAVYMEDG